MKNQTYPWLSVVVIAAIGLIHLYMAPEEYGETPYMGILFGLNFVAAIVAAVGIYRRMTWGWLLGVGIAAGSLIGYLLSRTVGLPGMEIEAWLQPLGIFSLLAEGGFILLSVRNRSWKALPAS